MVLFLLFIFLQAPAKHSARESVFPTGLMLPCMFGICLVPDIIIWNRNSSVSLQPYPTCMLVWCQVLLAVKQMHVVVSVDMFLFHRIPARA